MDRARPMDVPRPAATDTLFESRIRPLESFQGLRVTVMGLGLFGGGKGVTEFLVRHGAEVTVTDRRSPEELRPATEELSGLPVRWVLGEHRKEDFLGADLVIPNPAVPRTADLLRECRAHGVPLDTEMNLLFKYCRGRICAITGSNGKTTTTALLGAMAARRWPDVRVGGNLGKSLLPEVDRIGAGEWAVIEISSFQLEDLASISRRPDVSVLTNVSPNHLDRHGTYDEYLRTKRVILEPGPADGVAILNAEDALVRSWAHPGRRTLFFGRTGAVRPRAEGAWLDDARGEVLFSSRGVEETLFRIDDLRLIGRFNVLNAAAAAAAARALGLGVAEILPAIREFRPVEHRLELVLEHRGVRYYNDSIATTPESTIVGLEALGPNAVVICGGSSKGCSYVRLGETISRRARAVVLIGRTGPEIRRAIPARSGGPELVDAGSLEEAVRAAARLARPGDSILLSPACASFDMFLNFVDRGLRFKEIVRRLAAER